MSLGQSGARTFTQYRAVAMDHATEVDPPGFERGIVFGERHLAEDDLAEMMREANPTFDEGWIETRTVTEWRRSE